MKKVVLALLVMMVVCAGCSMDQKQTEANVVNDQQTTYSNNQPVHVYPYSPERAELQEILDARMKDVNTWTVVFSMGVPIFSCPSKGFPIPYTTQFTNPSVVAGTVTLPQAEPNGLYTGQTNATWILCIRDGRNVPVYSETDAIAFSYPVEVRDNKIVDAGGESSIVITPTK